MEKTLALFLALAMLFGLVACSGSGDQLSRAHLGTVLKCPGIRIVAEDVSQGTSLKEYQISDAGAIYCAKGF